jgi:hypothetical protein
MVCLGSLFIIVAKFETLIGDAEKQGFWYIKIIKIIIVYSQIQQVVEYDQLGSKDYTV